MNTPAHVVINLLVLSRNPNHRKSLAIVAGALIPDMVIIVFYGWHKLIGTAERQIWSIEYYQPFWQGWIDSFNSIPLILLAMLLCWKMRLPILLLLLTSMLLHTFGDLPLHHDDGHGHFFPFSDWHFVSSISYWDPGHYGDWVGKIEFALVVAASTYLCYAKPVLRVWIIPSLLIYLCYWVYVMLVWS
ncbi:MAG: hypothetical protein ACI87H_002971 [Gammaproteobacteria bacterium]|jgi:hypothetical protein